MTLSLSHPLSLTVHDQTLTLRIRTQKTNNQPSDKIEIDTLLTNILIKLKPNVSNAECIVFTLLALPTCECACILFPVHVTYAYAVLS